MKHADTSVSEERYRRVFEAMADGVLVVGPTDHLLSANPAGLCLLGISGPLESGGRPVEWQWLDRADQPLRPEQYPFAQCRRTGQPVRGIRAGLLRPDGTVVHVFGCCLPDAEPGNVVMILTEPAESARGDRSAETLRAAVEDLDDMVVITDAGGSIEYVNPAFTRFSGYAAEEVLGRTPLLLTSGEHDRGFYRQILETIRQGRPWKGRMVNRWKDRSLCEQDVTIVPVSGTDGVTTHFVSFLRDRNERRELETQLAHAQRLETTGILAGNIAHDFNNLLTIIGCNVATILETVPENDPRRHQLLDAQKASDQAAELTRDLLTFSRRTKPRSITCDLNKVVSEAVRLMRHTVLPHVQLRTELASEPLLMRGDPTQLHQVIVNLCVNARDAMLEGGILTLRTSDRIIDALRDTPGPQARPGEFVVLSVEDTGCGMEPLVLARAFDPFFTTKSPGRGTGLGLTIVRNIVTTHQGWVELDSAPGQGTHVHVYFPSRTTLVDEPQRMIDPDSLRGVGTILVIDDEPMIVALLRTVLESRGYQTLTASTAQEAAERFAQSHASVTAVVLDRNLPRVGGLSVFQQMRLRAGGVPIVLISGSTPAADEEPLPADKNTRFLAKPFTPLDVLEALRSLRSGGRRSPSPVS